VTHPSNQSLQDQYAPNLVCFGCGPANPQGLRLKSFVLSEPTEDQQAGLQQALEKLGNSPGSDSSGQLTPREILIARFQPQEYHLAFPGVVNGGIISTLLDCHMNWTAAWQLMLRNHLESPPSCVTANYQITFKAPTPAGALLLLQAWAVEVSDRKGKIFGILGAAEEGDVLREVTATGEGTFVAVKPGHPAFHRW